MALAGRKPVPGGAVERARTGIETGNIEAMSAPEDLTEEAAQIWDIALSDLIPLKMFRLSDAPMLAEFCSSLAMAREFRREIQDLTPIATATWARVKGLTGDAATEAIKDAESISGQIKRARSGYVQMLKLAQSIGGDFGMTPVARLRLGLVAAQAANTLHSAYGGSTDAGQR